MSQDARDIPQRKLCDDRRAWIKPGLGRGLSLLRRRSHRTWLTWLAMAALWLTIVAPVISQTLPTTSATFDLGAWCTGHGLDTHPKAPADPAAATDRCGYCGLLGHSPLAFGHADFSLPPSSLPALVPIARTLPAQIPSRLISAAPRGPPSPG